MYIFKKDIHDFLKQMPLFILDGVAMWILLLGNSVSSIPILFEAMEPVPKNV